MWTVHVEIHGVLDRKQVISLIHTGNFNNRKFANECISTLEPTLFFVCHAQKDMDSFRLKLAVILVNYAWNKIKVSPGFKISDIEEPYKLEETEKKNI
jgi:hypothetical protein